MATGRVLSAPTRVPAAGAAAGTCAMTSSDDALLRSQAMNVLLLLITVKAILLYLLESKKK